MHIQKSRNFLFVVLACCVQRSYMTEGTTTPLTTRPYFSTTTSPRPSTSGMTNPTTTQPTTTRPTTTQPTTTKPTRITVTPSSSLLQAEVTPPSDSMPGSIDEVTTEKSLERERVLSPLIGLLALLFIVPIIVGIVVFVKKRRRSGLNEGAAKSTTHVNEENLSVDDTYITPSDAADAMVVDKLETGENDCYYTCESAERDFAGNNTYQNQKSLHESVINVTLNRNESLSV